MNTHEAAVLLGRAGGIKGGPARAKALSAERLKQIASKAARTRWAKEKTSADKNKAILRKTKAVVEKMRGNLIGDGEDEYETAIILLLMAQKGDSPRLLAKISGCDIKKIVEIRDRLYENKILIDHKLNVDWFGKRNSEDAAFSFCLDLLCAQGYIQRSQEPEETKPTEEFSCPKL